MVHHKAPQKQQSVFFKNFFVLKNILMGMVHPVVSHSLRANLDAQALEAKIGQDSGQLDGLRAIGIARGFATAGR
ncbi:MAG: hypothetical protein ACO3A2_02660 [Bdellovibrionia bacterium]